MTEKIIDIQKARQDKRQKTGWTLAEILKRAEEERETYAKLAKNEPDALASGGDMNENRPDPTTKEGGAKIDAILKHRKAEAEEFRKIALTDFDDEPTGKLTSPSDIDLHRDRKENDD